ncbi:hypothetical protein N4T20_18190 [Flavobacterium sp. TR2]|uniref:hypothetical protein n=1 Tax=Flavobacterium sp. TR2 TaxID=2977321 RepID=UPI0021B1106E|nr:hypothetical protein [Flavobacterium sp. TR2]UWY27649.1 hypothetical protein N4T20_18190 [Flavobacterium sp. TR2]
MRKNRSFTRTENAILKQRFISDFASGKTTIEELSRKYNVHRRKLVPWKNELFGTGSLKRKRMYQMHISGIPTRVIADFYGVHIVQVGKGIRETKKLLTEGKITLNTAPYDNNEMVKTLN